MSVTLFPIAEALHWRAKQWKPGGDWCFIRYGKWVFIKSVWLTCSCPKSAKNSCSCRKNCAVSEGGWDGLLPTKWKGGRGDNCFVWGWSGWWGLLQIAIGIDTGFGKRLCPCKDQRMGSKHSPTCSLPALSQVAPCTWLTWRLKGSWTLCPSRNGNFCAHSCSMLSTGFVRWVEPCLQVLEWHWGVAFKNTNLGLQGCNCCWRRVLHLGNLLQEGPGNPSVFFSSLSFILYPAASSNSAFLVRGSKDCLADVSFPPATQLQFVLSGVWKSVLSKLFLCLNYEGSIRKKDQSHYAGEQGSHLLVKGIGCCLLLGMCEALPAVLCPVWGSRCHSEVSPAEATGWWGAGAYGVWGVAGRAEVVQPGEGKPEGRAYCGLLLWSSVT